MKRFVLFFLFTGIFFVSMAALAAQCGTTPTDVSGTELCNPLENPNTNLGPKPGETSSVVAIILYFIRILTMFTGGMSIIFVVYSGVRMILSQGQSEEVTKGKDALKWAIYGLVLSLLAFVVVSAVGKLIGIQPINPSTYEQDTAIIQNPLGSIINFGEFIYGQNGFLANALGFVGILAILMIVISGFRYITAQGHEEQSRDAKQALQWSIAGLGLTILAYVIIRAVEALIASR